jgi:hypothetical protein
VRSTLGVGLGVGVVFFIAASSRLYLAN